MQTQMRVLAKQEPHSYKCRIYTTQNNCQPISKSQSSTRVSRYLIVLYGGEDCKTTTTIINKVQVFANNFQRPLIGYRQQQPAV
ncbi:unnamed protein product [Schistosoma margrebowiei]|uniref:Uncharacterized protein n=1 Tax=Schistosoma margrebowiei TaxID=48269 RepID=A0A183MQ15_9TREM|nr:unnamed protein product [Schistosoma margrebowiei]